MYSRFFHAFTAVTLATGVACAPALAGDVWGPRDYGSSKDAPYAAGFSWTGLYVGGQAGLATGNTQGDPDLGFGPPGLFSTDYDMDGALYGGHIGYNYQAGNLVVGIEGTFEGASIQGDTACVVILECRREVDWVGTVVGRLGYASGRAMVYGMGGIAWADMNTNVSIAGVSLLNGNETHTGWVLGGGLAYAVSDQIIARVEYAHMDFGSENHELSSGGFSIGDEVDAEIDTVRLGVSFKFGGDRRAPVEPLK